MQGFYRKIKLVLLLNSLVMLLLFSSSVVGQVPENMSYQGLLKDNNGIVLDGEYNLHFRIYDSESETTSIWNMNFTGISVNEGIFSVILENFDNLTFDKQYWFGITVNGGEELLPRTEFTSVPYALMTKEIPDNIVTSNKIKDGSIAINDLNFSPLVNPLDANLQINGNLNITGEINANILDVDSIDVGSGCIRAKEFISTSSYLGIYSNKSAFIDIDHDNNGDASFSITSDNEDKTLLRIWENLNGEKRITLLGGGFNTYYPIYLTDDTKIAGDLLITGSISKGSGTFKIDHPLDPENKYLYHSFVESPDMMNVYNGNIELNNNGDAIVELPSYFEALNMEFRYQLTCIGGFAPVYIAEKISGNNFRIAGGIPNLEVSWQVTGIRKDPYAEKNRIKVEVEKTGDEIGKYLHYKEYNMSENRSIESLKNRKTK